MKLASFLGIAVFAALATAAPIFVQNIIALAPNIFVKIDITYTSQRDIVSLTVPLNSVNFEDEETLNNNDSDLNVFFVEADIKDDGKKDYKGLYLLKGSKATKILETGTDSAADQGNSKYVYISATDGLYVYNSESGKVERYGSVTDNLISVVKLNSSDTLYVLTADYVVYKVTDNGEKKTKVDELTGARQIVLDNSDNLYYYGADKHPYVLTEGGIKKIEGLPANSACVALYKPPFLWDDKVAIISDSKMDYINADGTIIKGSTVFPAMPSAIASEGMFVLYYAFNKSIYNLKYPNLTLLDDMRKQFKSKYDKIHSVASRVRGAQ